MAHRHEWDFDYEPAPRQKRETPPLWTLRRRSGWADPRVTCAVDIFWKAIWRALGAILAVVLSVMGLGALWLLGAALRGF